MFNQKTLVGNSCFERERIMTNIIGLVILVLDILAIVKIVQSKATLVSKLLWALLVLVLPLLGLIIWWLMGPKK
jgi:hypothetical protein